MQGKQAQMPTHVRTHIHTYVHTEVPPEEKGDAASKKDSRASSPSPPEQGQAAVDTPAPKNVRAHVRREWI